MSAGRWWKRRNPPVLWSGELFTAYFSTVEAMPRPCSDSDHENTLSYTLPSTVTGTVRVPWRLVNAVVTSMRNFAAVLSLATRV